jgi:Peptidase C13 family
MRLIWSHVVALFRNIGGGLRVATFLPASRRSFSFGGDQAFILVFASIAVQVITSHPLTWRNVQFNAYGWSIVGLGCFIGLITCYLVSRIQGAVDQLTAMLVVLFATRIALHLCYAIIVWSGGPYWRWVRADPTNTTTWAMFVLLSIWFWTVLMREVRVVFDAGRIRAAFLAVGMLAVAWLPACVSPTTHLWYAATPVAEQGDPGASHDPIDAERVYYAQQHLLAEKLEALTPQRPGIVDLYFVGFAGTSSQDVFLKEARSAQKLFDQRFDTRGRSLLLVNNPRTLDGLPIASVSNLRLALQGVAKKMNAKEDVLFLFLTSHGSKHVFSVSFPELGLDDLTDRELREILDHAGIKWRVIVISACYSGSFIDALKDDRSLIITAARQDRTSFGCSSENDFTYFGDAYINHALRQGHSFTAGFVEARRLIAAREKQENLTPSEPQIYLGKDMREKLERLQRQLDRPLKPRDGH